MRPSVPLQSHHSWGDVGDSIETYKKRHELFRCDKFPFIPLHSQSARELTLDIEAQQSLRKNVKKLLNKGTTEELRITAMVFICFYRVCNGWRLVIDLSPLNFEGA